MLKDWNEYKTVTVDESVLNDRNTGFQELFNESGAGTYSVMVRDEKGHIAFSASWQIEPKQSTTGYIILAVVLGIVGIGILVFIRMRHKMTTK